MRKAIIIIATVLVLGGVNYSIYQKEQLLAKGKTVFLELAPVDPRSLMQGDYMALRFRSAVDAFNAMHDQRNSSRDGKLVLAVDERNVGTFKRLDNGAALSNNEVAMRYRIRNDQLKFATNAFFFQEGQANVYTTARFGEFRVAENGECILTGLHDADLKLLGRGK